VTSTPPAPPQSAAPPRSLGTGAPRRWAALTALGIVYGDLGTSPLYTLQTVVEATGGRFSAADALGVLSLIFWTLIITISIKYCLFVMRADNHGEGGMMALMSLIGANSLRGRMGLLTVMGLLGTALIYGDGVITPAISVLSALEGLNVVTPAFAVYVLPATILILILLFALQRFGTEHIGQAFGPVMLLWFLAIAALGASGIAHHPEVLVAVDPRYGAGLLLRHGTVGLLVLGGVFLCITGGEALYADMGHIGKGPIRGSWYCIVLPSLLLSYAGQTGLLLGAGTLQGNPFFQLAPRWALYPLVALATIATIIASQAIITGSFSMTRQAMQLGWLPGFDIQQTSDRVYGQIYVPVINWLMMVTTLAVTFGFKSSARLAGAYGTAVSTTMLLTSCLLVSAMYKVWRWPPIAAFGIGAIFVLVDLSFFCANLLKIADGGWLPLTIGLLIFALMHTWRSGTDAVRSCLLQSAPDPTPFLAQLAAGRVARVPGTAVFLTRTAQRCPRLIVDHAQHIGALHAQVLAVAVLFEEIPRVPPLQCYHVESIAPGIWRVTIRFGFMEIPDVKAALARMSLPDPAIDIEHAMYFGARDLVVRAPGSSQLRFGRLPLFAFLYRNAVKIVDRFNLPPENVWEISRLIPL
jgi:KUP system potassium uptake protein